MELCDGKKRSERQKESVGEVLLFFGEEKGRGVFLGFFGFLKKICDIKGFFVLMESNWVMVG
jgi:hypothetical protein